MRLIERSGMIASRLITKMQSRERIAYELHTTNRLQIGYIIRGEKHFVYSNDRLVCREGELFINPIGQLCCENISTEGSGVYEQITFSFNSADLASIFSAMMIEPPQEGVCLSHQRAAIFRPSKVTHAVVESVNIRYNYGGFVDTPLSEKINVANLIVSIFENDDEILKQIIASVFDTEQVNFQRLIYDNIFIDRGLNDLAEESNRSLTTFKKDFRRNFGNSPHNWFLQQRLLHAQNLLAITNDSIAHIGALCTFANTSHFIKIYKSHFGITPAQHRLQLRALKS